MSGTLQGSCAICHTVRQVLCEMSGPTEEIVERVGSKSLEIHNTSTKLPARTRPSALIPVFSMELGIDCMSEISTLSGKLAPEIIRYMHS